MGIEKEVKTRKIHKCAICNRDILIGSKAMFYSERFPKYNDDGTQSGIEYGSWYICQTQQCENDKVINLKRIINQ